MFAASAKRISIVGLVLAACVFTTDVNAEISWQRSPEQVLRSSRESGKPILVFVTAQWCHYCQKMKRETWSDMEVSTTVRENFETLVLDGDKNKKIVDQLGLNGFPATLIYNPDGQFVTKKDGFMPPKAAVRWLGKTLR